MSNYIEASSISADGGLIQWNATAGALYNSGQSVEEFGVSNLSEVEMKRLNLTNYIEHPASGKVGTFASKYDEHAERNGQTFTVLGTVDPATYDAEECGTMYCIRFADGAEIEAWPEEVETAIVARSPVDCLCQSGHNPT